MNHSLWFFRHNLFPLNTNLSLRRSRYYSKINQNKREAGIVEIKIKIDVDLEFDIVYRFFKIINM